MKTPLWTTLVNQSHDNLHSLFPSILISFPTTSSDAWASANTNDLTWITLDLDKEAVLTSIDLQQRDIPTNYPVVQLTDTTTTAGATCLNPSQADVESFGDIQADNPAPNRWGITTKEGDKLTPPPKPN